MEQLIPNSQITRYKLKKIKQVTQHNFAHDILIVIKNKLQQIHQYNKTHPAVIVTSQYNDKDKRQTNLCPNSLVTTL